MNYTEDKGYIQVSFKGEKRWAHFGMNALKILQDELGMSLQELAVYMQSENAFVGFQAMADLIYVGMKSFDLQNDNEINYNRATCLEDAMLLDEIEVSSFMKSLAFMNGVDYIMRGQKGKIKLENLQQE